MPDPDPEHLAQVRGGVGRDQEDAPADVGEADRRGARHRGLPDAALPGEEEVARREPDEVHGAPQQHFLPLDGAVAGAGGQQAFGPAAASGLAAARDASPASSASSARAG